MAFPILPVAAGISALGSIFGGISANKKRREAEKQLEQRQRRLDQWYLSETATPYLDRADSRAMLKRIRDYNADELRALNTNAIKAGATDEAKVAAAGRLNRNYSQSVAQIAGLGEQHKDQVGREYRARRDELDDARYRAKLGEGDGVQTMVGNMGNAFGSLAAIYGMAPGVRQQKLAPVNTGGFTTVGGGVQPLELSEEMKKRIAGYGR